MGSVTRIDGRTVAGSVGYFGAAPAKPAFHAKDHRRDNWTPDVRPVTFHDARGWAGQPSLFREGVALVRHETAVYNVWRVLSPPPQDMPLAVCDARTVAREDLVAARPTRRNGGGTDEGGSDGDDGSALP
jgi:hypothetical protein